MIRESAKYLFAQTTVSAGTRHLGYANAFALILSLRLRKFRHCSDDTAYLDLLSKFGKLEAIREGLTDAFGAAIRAEVPVLTSVSPAFEKAWAQFASPLFVTLPADPAQVRS
jgi:hypothetical protein